MKKLIIILAVCMMTGTGYASECTDKVAEDVLIEMEMEEQLTAEDINLDIENYCDDNTCSDAEEEVLRQELEEERLDTLRDTFISVASKLLERCDDFGFTDSEVDDIDEAADLYIDDLREREQL